MDVIYGCPLNGRKQFQMQWVFSDCHNHQQKLLFIAIKIRMTFFPALIEVVLFLCLFEKSTSLLMRSTKICSEYILNTKVQCNWKYIFSVRKRGWEKLGFFFKKSRPSSKFISKLDFSLRWTSAKQIFYIYHSSFAW